MAGEAAEYYMRGSNDWLVGADFTSSMDVYYSSGVYNKAFYLLATTNGRNTKTVFNVYVRANHFYWNSSTNYNSGACGAESAAANLGYGVSAVTASLAAVGISCQ